MTNVFRKGLVLGSILAFGLTVGAVAQDDDHDKGWYQSREGYYHGEHWRARFFERVRDDVDRVQSTTFPVSKDEYRLARTKEELGELQEKLAAGQYDQGELDEVINSLQKVVDSNKLSHRDRDMLSEDLDHMREYREHHEEWVRDHS